MTATRDSSPPSALLSLLPESLAQETDRHRLFGAAEKALAEGRLEETMALMQRVLMLEPDNIDALNNVAALYLRIDHPLEALATLRAALKRAPEDSDLVLGLTLALLRLGRPRDSATVLRRLLASEPDNPTAQWTLALALLQLGDFANGWPAYEWRDRAMPPSERPSTPPLPRWDGAPLAQERPVLVTLEQGVGDNLMFAGLLPDLCAQGIRVLLACDRDPRLVSLLRDSLLPLCGDMLQVIESWQPDCQGPGGLAGAHIPLGSLPGLLRPRREGFQPLPAYLRGPEARHQTLRRRYEGLAEGRRLVGISWRSGNQKETLRRSLPLSLWEPLLRLPGCFFVDLQFGDHSAELAAARDAGLVLYQDPDIDPVGSLEDAAAQIAAMDRIVTIDNTVAHMAGCLGQPTLVLLPVGAEWRWGLEGGESYWYPSLTLLRQTELRNWVPVIDAAAALLSAAS